MQVKQNISWKVTEQGLKASYPELLFETKLHLFTEGKMMYIKKHKIYLNTYEQQWL